MAARYGLHRRLRNAAIALICAFLLLAAPIVGRAASVEAPPVRILVLGDSLTAGYGLPHDQGFQSQLTAAMAQSGQPVQLLDGAVSGDTTAGGRARLDWVLADKPQAAIVELGANDGLRGIDPGVTEANLTAILDRLASLKIPVLFSGMYAPPNLGPQYDTAFRAVFDRLGQRPGIIYDPFFLDGVVSNPALNQGDGIHPNPEGVRLIVARMLPAVKRLADEVPPP